MALAIRQHKLLLLILVSLALAVLAAGVTVYLQMRTGHVAAFYYRGAQPRFYYRG